jgi:hypothetical protein
MPYILCYTQDSSNYMQHNNIMHIHNTKYLLFTLCKDLMMELKLCQIYNKNKIQKLLT